MALIDLASSAPNAADGSGAASLSLALTTSGGNASAGVATLSLVTVRLGRESIDVGVAEQTVDARIGRESVDVAVAEQTVDARVGRVEVIVGVSSPLTYWGIPLLDETGAGVEVFYHDTRAASTYGTAVLTLGVDYRVILHGNFNVLDDTWGPGGYWDNIIYGDAGHIGNRDAEFKYGQDTRSDGWPGSEFHKNNCQFDIGDGLGFSHIEPIGGQPSVSNPIHRYEYQVTGQGAVLGFRMLDSPLSDNHGYFRVEISLA